MFDPVPDVGGGFDPIATIFPIMFGLIVVIILATSALAVYRLVRDREKIAAYREAMYQLPGEILKATREGDLERAQLLQGQLTLMQQQELLRRRGAASPGTFGAGMPVAGMIPPGQVPGDINGDGIPGNEIRP